MNKYTLSILIPARNEMFLAKTVESLLKKKSPQTEIIVGLDGQWANPSLQDHPDLTIVYFPEALGQRANTNQLCRLSRAKYVMKLDAHCDLDQGFDVKLITAMEDDMTISPMMRNLHAFDWVCIGKSLHPIQPYSDDLGRAKQGCGKRTYQGPTPEKCDKCGGQMERQLLWIAKESPKSTSFCFDTTLHFQYFNDFKKRPEGKGELTPTLSLQGSCFMLTRKKYWELNICDEEFGSWGQQGVEVACKTWFSGGRVMCLQSTWYAHMFRTQGGDFSFPYPQSGKQIAHARRRSRELFQQGNWAHALPGRTLEWLLQKFYPVPYWHNVKEKEKKEILFYTDNQLKLAYAHRVQNELKKTGLPIVSASLKPMSHFGRNVHIRLQRGLDAYFTQIIKGLETVTAQFVFMCEHDVIYHRSHFDFTPPTNDHFYYNINFWRIRPEVDDFAVHWDAPQVSGLCANRLFLLEWYKKKWEKIQRDGFDRSYEPGGRNSDLVKTYKSAFPNIDIRHGNNLTKSKWSLDDFRDKSTAKGWQESRIDKIAGWPDLKLLVVKK